jgi:hypothetical protein
MEGWWSGEQSFPFRESSFDILTAGAGGITSIAGIAELSGQGHPVGRLGRIPKTRGVHVTAPVRPRPYRRPRRAGAFRGPILLQPRSFDRSEASELGTARSYDPGSSHPPAAIAAGSFAYLTKPVSAQRRPGTEPESNYLYARFCDSLQADSRLWCIPECLDDSSGNHLSPPCILPRLQPEPSPPCQMVPPGRRRDGAASGYQG